MSNFTPVGAEAVVKGLGQFKRDMKSVNSSLRNTGGAGTAGAAGIKSFGSGLATIGATAVAASVAGLALVGAGLVTVGTSGLKASISYESAFTGVLKTTNGLTDEFGNLNAEGKTLRQGFIELSKTTPISAEELAYIGELGGQLGIAKESMLGFTETVAAMGVSTNLTTEEAAQGFSRLGNIMGTSQSDYDRLGSSIVSLGNNFATNESEILQFGLRLAGAGQTVGLTEAQVLGIGAALSSVGVNAEAGGTSVQKALLKIQESVVTGDDKLAGFAATAGMSAEEFQTAWKNDAGSAFAKFVTGLGQQGDGAITTLNELGMTDQRTISAFLRLAGSGDLLNETMANSTKAWSENTALTREAELRYGTTESKLTLLKNAFHANAIAIGDALSPAFNILVDSLLKATGGGSSLLPVFENIGKWLESNLPTAIENTKAFIVNSLIPAFNNAKDIILNNVIPAIISVVTWFKTNLPPAIEAAQQVLNEVLIPAFIMVSDWLKTNLPPAIETAKQVFDSLSQKVDEGGGVIQKVVDNVFIPLKAWFSENMPLIRAVVETAWIVIQDVITAVGKVISEQIMPAIQSSIDTVKETVSKYGVTWGDVWEKVGAVLKVIGEVIGAVILTIIAVVLGLVEGIVNAVQNILEAWEKMTSGIQEFSDSIKAFIDDMVGAIVAIFHGDWQGALDFIQSAHEDMQGILEGIWLTIQGIVQGTIGTILSAIGGFIDGFIGFFRNLYDELVGHSIVPDLVNDMKRIFLSIDWGGVGSSIASGIKSGLSSGLQSLKDEAIRLVKAAWDAAKSWLGWHSPAKRFVPMGEGMGQGVELGLENRTPNVAEKLKQMLGVGLVASPNISAQNNFTAPSVVSTNSPTFIFNVSEAIDLAVVKNMVQQTIGESL